MTDPSSTAQYQSPAETISRWYAEFIEQGGRAGRGVPFIVGQAEGKARQYREMGTAYDDFQPGNGTSYKLVLHDMNAPYVRLMTEKDVEPSDEDWLIRLAGFIKRNNETEAALWEYASRHTMAACAGGELLVSLPENGGGRCTVLSVFDGALYTPDYIGQALGIRLGDAVPLAVYLTAFVCAVARLRNSDGESRG